MPLYKVTSKERTEGFEFSGFLITRYVVADSVISAHNAVPEIYPKETVRSVELIAAAGNVLIT